MRSYAEIFLVFLRLGLTSFGGPIAHLGYLRQELVVKKRWLADSAYADLVALCQFLPGPASSQVVFGAGIRRGGLAGGVVASLGFTAPSALIMLGLALFFRERSSSLFEPWLSGLRLAAVAIVAQALTGMYRTLCPDVARIAIAAGAAMTALLWANATGQIVIMLLGALAGWLIVPKDSEHGPTRQTVDLEGEHSDKITDDRPDCPSTLKVSPTLVWTIFLGLLFGLPLLARLTGSSVVVALDSYYRSGALVFGGGHVVLPLLHDAVVAKGWVSERDFMDGYGAAQALPGPLFTFAGFLGVLGRPGGLSGGLTALLAIFLPGWLLILSTLRSWSIVSRNPVLWTGLRGTNAAVVGILAAAFYRPICTQGVRTYQELVFGLLLYGLLVFGKLPSWVVVLLAALLGQLRLV
jgi:chromate transporter